MKKTDVLRTMFKYLRPVLPHQFLLLSLIVTGSAMTLAFPYILKVIIDDVFPSKDYALLQTILLVLVATYLVRALTFFSSGFLSIWIGNKIVSAIREDLFKNVIRREVTFFHSTKPGEIVYRIFNEVNVIQSTMTHSIVRFLNNFSVAVGLVFTLMYLSFDLFLSTIWIYPIALSLSVVLRKKVKASIKDLREKDSVVMDYLTERITKFRIMKLFASFTLEERYLKTKIQWLNRALLKNASLTSANQNGSAFILSLIPVLVFFVGGKSVLAGTMTVGVLVAFTQYANKLYAPVNDLIGLYTELLKSYVSFERINEYLQVTVNTSKQNIIEDQRPISKIQFHGVSKNYEHHEVLRNISLTFERGGSYGLIGPSGSGKSSIINLLLKFYSPEAGNITANESKLSTIDDVKWSHKVLAVTSNEVFFHGTIRENLQYNNTNANTELNNAIEFVGLDRYINSLPLGMDTVIGENAVKFSAGQLQRLAIARALLWNPDVLILDEATSALDSSSEDNILQRIIIQFKERILIVISHRLSSLKYLNTMICLENGQVIENGPANVLRSESEFYRNLFHEQLEISDGRPLANRT